MKNKNKKSVKNSNKAFAIFMGVIWAVILSVFILSFVKIFTYESVYYPNPDHAYSRIAEHNYGGAYSQYLSVLSNHVNADKAKEYAEIVALGEYEGASVLYNMYKEHGMTDKASIYEARKNEAKLRMGKLGFTVDEIDAILTK